MAYPKLVFYLALLFLGKITHTTDLPSSLRQESGFISAHVGDNVTLRCFYDSNVVARYYWYKQNLGHKPRLISTFYMYDKNTHSFYDECKNNSRFSLDTRNGKNHLIITDLHLSDSATYYCASSFSISFEFGDSITVTVKGSGLNIQALVHQSVSETTQTGGSVTLNCTVQTGTCDGKHSVYWFKDSEEYTPRIFYTHGDRNYQCEKKNNTQIKSCVYNLPMRSLNRSHAGTYYCAVAFCGHILFGNGTKVELVHSGNTRGLVYLLSSTLVFTTILTISLAVFVCMFSKRYTCKCTESRACSASFTAVEGYRDVDNIHYSTLRVSKASSSRGQREDTDVVYSRVKQ